MLVTDPTEIPDERFTKLYLAVTDDGDYHVTARNNGTTVSVDVDSIGIGPESIGFVAGDATFDAGSAWIRLDYVEFEEYGYDEIQVTFEER